MKKVICLTAVLFWSTRSAPSSLPQWGLDTLGYHAVKVDELGRILPWYSADPAVSYDFIIKQVWQFWDTMRTDWNGLPYYMNHQVWREGVNDPRGIGGGQIQMAMSSWRLLYNYTGNEQIKENIKFMADYYLAHGLSPADCKWPNLPFPYNTLIYSGVYDGDMILGKGYTQPDKAGWFGYELVQLAKMLHRDSRPNITGERYLEFAEKIADTLAKHTQAGSNDASPLPFKVNVFSGEIGQLKNNDSPHRPVGLSAYTTNWSGTMELFIELIKMKRGNVELYRQALDKLVNWMKSYPLKTNKWGPFFEDIPGWSDTQINAVTFAWFMMKYPEYFPNWKRDVPKIFDWVYQRLGNDRYAPLSVVVVNEQTAYETPGNSHTSRQASAELWYAKLSGDSTRIENAVRQLNWATYMVADDGRNCYPFDEIWLTDGYGDYVGHFLRAMAAMPELAPAAADHLLWSTSIICHVAYAPNLNKFLVPDVPESLITKTVLFYRTYDAQSQEVLRLKAKPEKVLVNGNEIPEGNRPEGWTWQPLKTGGVLTITKQNGKEVLLLR